MSYGVLLQHLDTTQQVDFEMLIGSKTEWERVKTVELQLAEHHETLTFADVLALGILVRKPGQTTWQSAPARKD